MYKGKFNRTAFIKDRVSQSAKRGSRWGTGGPPPPPPPWDVSEVGSYEGAWWEAWWVGEGVHRFFFQLIDINFFLARYARHYYTNVLHIYILQYSVWKGRPFSIFPLSKLWKESNFPSLAFMKGHFQNFLVQNHTIIHHWRQKYPLPDTFPIKNYHVMYMFV